MAPISAAMVPARNSPSSFEAPINTELTALTRPRTSSGVHSCMMVSRIDTETMSQAPISISIGIDSQIDCRQAENGGEQAEQRDEDEQDAAGMVADREARQQQRGQDGADARRGAQDAEADRADMQDIEGKDRQQRHGAAHQHGEQVERDGAEHDLFVPDVAETGEQGADAGRRLRRSSASVRR